MHSKLHVTWKILGEKNERKENIIAYPLWSQAKAIKEQ